MLNYILHLTKDLRRAKRIPKAYKLVFKEGALEAIMQTKGWRNNAAMAKETGYTRQYISMVRRGVVSVTHDFLIRVLELTGNIDNPNWSQLFRIIPRGDYNPAHQMWNNSKIDGIKQYQKHSISAEFRAKDQTVETTDRIINAQRLDKAQVM